MAGNEEQEPKLPVQQLTILAVARFAEPLAMTSIYPYLPEMIRSFGVKQNEVAKWAGITSAAFSVAQSVTAVPWGKASDRFGRKPTIVFGLTSTLLLFLVWGVSTSLPMAIIVRVLLGSGNGNVGIIRTMVAEMVTDKRLQPRAFSVMPLVWSIGSIFGPAFGGMFVRPVERFPGLFGNSTFFKTYPFALPNIMMAIFFLISLSCALFFLKETLESRRDRKDWGLRMGKRLTRPFRRTSSPGRTRRASFVDGEATAPLLPTKINRHGERSKLSSVSAEQPTMKEVFTPQTIIGLISYTFLALHSVAFDQVLPVFLNTPDQDQTPENSNLPLQFTGGFGLAADRIGTIFAVYGITCGLVQFIVFPPLCKRVGVLNCFKICAFICPFVYFLTPFTILFPTTVTRFAALAIIMLFKAFAIIIGFPCITILLTNSASDLRILGTLNGFATMFSGLGRALGPAGAGAAFSWGVDHGYVITAWWLLALVAALGSIPALMLAEGEGPSAGTDDSSEEEDVEGEDEDDDEYEYEDAIASDSYSDDPDLATDEETLRGSGYASQGDRDPAGEDAPLLEETGSSGASRRQQRQQQKQGYNSIS